MAGFGPIGSAPVASLGGSLSGTIVTPRVGSVTVAGFTPTLTGTDPAQVASINREVLLGASGTVISASVVREVLRQSYPLTPQGGSISILW